MLTARSERLIFASRPSTSSPLTKISAAALLGVTRKLSATLGCTGGLAEGAAGWLAAAPGRLAGASGWIAAAPGRLARGAGTVWVDGSVSGAGSIDGSAAPGAGGASATAVPGSGGGSEVEPIERPTAIQIPIAASPVAQRVMTKARDGAAVAGGAGRAGAAFIADSDRLDHCGFDGGGMVPHAG
jgi:hypothetical protein